MIEKMSKTVEDAAHLLREAKYATAFTGAGISTPSGIPDFRSPHSGLWENVDPFEVASITGFRRSPRNFYNWLYPLANTTLNAQPNPAHLTLAALETKGYIQSVITQNIDGLHTRAGSQTIFELHGHLREMTCIHCFEVYDSAPVIERFLVDQEVPHCPKCNNVLKPNVILFGEQLPIQALLSARQAAIQADVLIVVGSSLEVAPASDLPALVARNGGKLIIINLEPTHLDRAAEIVIHEDAAVILPQIMQYLDSSL